ncbi:ImmA/IrrE family metallo-endopeptidase [Rhodococcus sp. SGAir0479]|nr:ImmA/IrrE family metallo-endopeptidase [Rhodococcus sp. SGAir0479]
MSVETVAQIRERARNDAWAVLDQYWDDGVFPVDPIKVAGAMGIKVYSASLESDCFGMIIGAPDGSADIYLDADQPLNRLRFTCAHEIGHYVDNTSKIDGTELAFVDRRSDAGRGTAPEVYANEFAGSLLMPADQISRELERNPSMTPMELAAKFEVSLDAMRYRLNLLKNG